MNATAIARLIEYRDIHLAACRHRAQGLACSTCSDLVEQAERAARRAAIRAREAA